MYNAKIKLVYKQVIDGACESSFEKAIFQASYQEFLLKSQAYNPEGKFKTFSELKANDGRANSLHYKLSFSIGHYIARLDNKMPLITDSLGSKLAFDIARFELLESHTEEISFHKVAINYETEILTLIELIGEYMLLAKGDFIQNEMLETFMVRLQPGLSIVGYQVVDQLKIA